MMLIKLLVFLCLYGTVHLQPNVLKDFCEEDTFKTTCEHANEVAVIETAKYGRMEIGKCLDHIYGNIGCFENVLLQLDRVCSGRATCTLNVRDLMVYNRCPKDLRGYLSVKYTCIKVEHPTADFKDSCLTMPPGTTKAPVPKGVLSNYVAETTACGGTQRPWLIEGSPGQRINMTIKDFVGPVDSNKNSWSTGYCQLYADIRDEVTRSQDKICVGEGRVRHAFISKSHSVMVKLIVNSDKEKMSYALIYYEVIGCRDFPSDPTSNKWFRRFSSDRASYGCNNNNAIYELKCLNNEWVGEDEDDCSTDNINLARSFFSGHFFTIEKIFVTILVTGLIGVIVLAIGVFIVRKKFRNRQNQQQMNQFTQPTDNPLLYSQKSQYMDRYSQSQQQQQHYFQQQQQQQQQHYQSVGGVYIDDKNFYQQQLLMQQQQNLIQNETGLPTISETTASINNDDYSKYNEHIYESPKSIRKELDKLNEESKIIRIKNEQSLPQPFV